MKIILWVANEAHQKALAHKINSQYPLAGIVIETRIHKRRFNLYKIISKIFERFFLRAIDAAWFNLLNHYARIYSKFPEVPVLNVENINSSSVLHFTESLKPDLILVSGTRLIKPAFIKIKVNVGILNLHTGLSPYIKGGPNCTNWCIATNQFHLIGNTIMWLDAGIDSGNILTTEFTPLNGTENFKELHLKVMEHAHSLYIQAINHLKSGHMQSIPQNKIAAGKTYFTKQWTIKYKIALIKNFNLFSTAFIKHQLLKNEIKIYPLH